MIFFSMIGMFNAEKVLQRCAGKYLTGSDMDSALIESNVFSPKALNSVLSGGHCVRALAGM